MLKGFVSNEALDIMVGELQRSNDIQLDSSNCGCRLRSSCGLPCACILFMYSNSGQCVPLDSIDIFWRTLDISPTKSKEDDDICCDAEVEKFKESFNRQSRPGKISLLRKLKNIFDAGTTSVQEPVVQKNTRGRPKLKKQSFVVQKDTCGRSKFMGFDLNIEPERQSFSIDLNNEPNGQCSNNERRRHSSYMAHDLFDQEPLQEPVTSMPYGYIYPELQQQDEYYYQQPMIQESIRYRHPLLYEIPLFFQPYVIGIEDVEGDGNCGFRSVAVAMGRHQNEWPIIRRELFEELQDNKKQYITIYGDEYKRLEDSLNFCGSGFAPRCHWMWMPNTGLLISNKYNCIVYYLTSAGSLTYFPLKSNPRSPEVNQSITIAFVHDIHFVKVDLEKGHPMPNVSALYKHFRKNRKQASEWKEMYKDRLLAYKEVHNNIDLNVM